MTENQAAMALKRPGRPTGGSSHCRQNILQAAQECFLAQGYSRTTLRAIAAKAEVNVALISYYFGSKEGLFGQVMCVQAIPSKVITAVFLAPTEQRAQVLLSAVVDLWEDPKLNSQLVSFVKLAVANQQLLNILQDYLAQEIVMPLVSHIGGRRASQRASSVMSIIMGLIFGRYILRIGPLADLSRVELYACLVPTLQAALARPRAGARQATSPNAAQMPSVHQ